MRVKISPTGSPTPGFGKIFAENYRPLASANAWSPFGHMSDANTGWPWHRENRIWSLLFPDREKTGKNFETQEKYFSMTQGKNLT